MRKWPNRGMGAPSGNQEDCLVSIWRALTLWSVLSVPVSLVTGHLLARRSTAAAPATSR